MDRLCEWCEALSTFLAGAAGAAVHGFLRPERRAWRAVAGIACGTLTAACVAPAVCDSYDLAAPSLRHAAAFGTGLVGMIACKAVLTAAESQAASGVLALLRRLLNKDPS